MHKSNYIPFFDFCQDFFCFFGIIPKISIDHLCTITKKVNRVIFERPLCSCTAGVIFISVFQKRSYPFLTKSSG